MDVIYTDINRIEQGVLQNFDIDFDTTDKKEFQITVGIKNNVLTGSAYWYIEGTEYGGKIDKSTIITESREIQYTGRNARGLLMSKIIEPPAGLDYLVLSGTLQSVIETLIRNARYDDLFVVDKSNIEVKNYNFARYINLYDGIVKLMASFNKIPKFTFKQGKIHISVYESIDYSDDNEYTQDDLNFTITKSYSDVNHLICLGQGQLRDRMVIHLYTDADGNISQTQSIVGENEVVATYENTNVAEYDELLKEGTARLKALKNKDSFEVTIPDIDLRIGDIIGGIDTNTGIYVAKDIVNIIAKINDYKMELEHKVGEDNTASSSGSSSSGSGGGDTFNLVPAKADRLGGIMVGDGLNIDENGKLDVAIDSELSIKSENPVQNKVITEKLNEVFQSVSNGKTLVASAITDKGVETSQTATFERMATNIRSIDTTGSNIVGIVTVIKQSANIINQNNFDTTVTSKIYIPDIQLEEG